ncbi:hypothetical protein ADIARSV_1550 [Arcticibacter svalbardensis MN12-7]|uniref:Uncharacterized protein n=1 Tax=Arcticibacter svalbardensis MN12-7 TaxID=1150600 RepID=R9GUC4_9SPHI|nr:hypothetical protein [Arcticibacter svalbardensis]EOR95273.1 hypothetical protein ADIARSV_1550 [Arcticibacter svalbardensis MN12-7]
MIKAGTISQEIVLTMDILPTFLDFIRQKPSGKNLDGISIKDNLLKQLKYLLEMCFMCMVIEVLSEVEREVYQKLKLKKH